MPPLPKADEPEAGAADEAATEAAEQQAWNDLEAMERGDEPTSDADNRDDPPADTEAEDATAAAAAEAEEQDDGAAASQDDDPPADGGKPAVSPEGDDLWADATPTERARFESAFAEATDEQRAAYLAARQRIKSANGRVSQQAREMNNLRRQLEEVTAKAPPADPAGGGEADPFEDDEWKEVEDQYPDVAKPLRAVVGRIVSTLQEENRQLKSQVGSFATATSKANYDDNYSSVLAEHQDYDAAIKSTEFVEWYQTAPRMVHEAVERNGKHIVDPTEVSEVIRLFKADTGFGGQTTEPEPKPGSPSKLEARRKAQLASSRAPRTRSPGRTTTAIPDDEQGAWDAFEKMGL